MRGVRGGVRTFVRVTSDGHPYAIFCRAVERGNLPAAEAAARELPTLTLRDALSLVVLYARKDRPRFERAAIRWHVRYQQEGERVSLRESALALAALHALPTEQTEAAINVLLALVER